MQDAQCYIEVFKNKEDVVLKNSARPIPIKDLEKNLAATRKALVLETFFVWKIKEKPYQPVLIFDEINGQPVTVVDAIN